MCASSIENEVQKEAYQETDSYIGGAIVQFLKGVNMKVVIELVAESWNEIQSTSSSISLTNLLQFVGEDLKLPSEGGYVGDGIPEKLAAKIHFVCQRC